MGMERLGGTSDSLRIRNNTWYVGRSFDGKSDIKVFRVNVNDEVEFFSVPSVNGDSFVLKSEFDALEQRVATLEAIVGGITAGNINIVPFTLTPMQIMAKEVVLPQSPISGKIVLFTQQGIPQLCDLNFEVTGNILSWDGYDLEQTLLVGDKIKVVYMF